MGRCLQLHAANLCKFRRTLSSRTFDHNIMSFEGFRIPNGKNPKRTKLAAAQFESDEDEQPQQQGAPPPLSNSRDSAVAEKVAAARPPPGGHASTKCGCDRL